MTTLVQGADGVYQVDDDNQWYESALLGDMREPPTVREHHGPRCQCRRCDPDSYFDRARDLATDRGRR